jgi:hypothetical protein
MSIPTKEDTRRFLAPLKGSLAVILLHEIQAKARLSNFLLRCASLQSLDTTILDSDAFYCTNMERLTDNAQPLKGEVLLLPERDFEVSSLVSLLSSSRRLLVIDDLNSLHSLASEGRRWQQLTILMKLLSHNARMNGSWAIATAYRTELESRQTETNQRSLTALGDLLIDTRSDADSIKLTSTQKGPWPGGEFDLR